jgi:hypothetical protein
MLAREAVIPDIKDESLGQCLAALDGADLRRVGAALARLGVTNAECAAEVARVTERAETRRRLLDLRASVAEVETPLPTGAFERFVVTVAACRSIAQLDSVPVSATVKRLCCEAFRRFADPATRLDASANRFIAVCKTATLRRFPAGQFDWEPSGLQRSWIPRIRPIGALARVIRQVAAWRGFGPAFFVHLGLSGRNYALFEREANRSYYHMARSLELQPHMKGLLASSWLHSPDTFSVSPHLAWLNGVFQENGAIIATMGAARSDCGVLHRSPERQRAYEEGRFQPTLGLVVWPRAQMIQWADRHPEFDW